MRRAVVIGNCGYRSDLPPFFYPLSEQGSSDAQSVATILDECGFRTQLLVDASDNQMDISIARLAEDTKNEDVAVIFFGGHAVDRNGEHYLFGTRSDRGVEAPSAGVKLSWLFSVFPQKALLLLFIDACRNTYVEKLDQSERGRLQDDFFQTIPAPAPPKLPPALHLVSWSTQAGQHVPDGEPTMHSPYAAALINGIEEGLNLPELLDQVVEDVELRTRATQTPCVEDPCNVLTARPPFVFYE